MQTVTENRLLAAMPAAEYERLVPHLELVRLKLSEVAARLQQMDLISYQHGRIRIESNGKA
jgi:hypothetical protein